MSTKYNWDFGDGKTSTEKTPKHNYLQKGTYSVKLKAQGNCGVTEKVKTISTTINEVKEEDSPTMAKSYSDKWCSLGKKNTIDASRLASDIYWLSLPTKNDVWRQKMVKE